MDGLAGGLAEGDEAGLAAFAGDTDEAGVEIDIFQAGVAEFRNAEAAGVEELEHGTVAEAERVARADAIDEAANLGFVQGGGHAFLRAREGEILSGIHRPPFAGDKETEKDANGHGVDAHGRGLEARTFAVDEELGDVPRLERCPTVLRVAGLDPLRECFQRALDEELVTVREPALGGEIHEELANRLAEGGILSGFGFLIAHNQFIDALAEFHNSVSF